MYEKGLSGFKSCQKVMSSAIPDTCVTNALLIIAMLRLNNWFRPTEAQCLQKCVEPCKRLRNKRTQRVPETADWRSTARSAVSRHYLQRRERRRLELLVALHCSQIIHHMVHKMLNYAPYSSFHPNNKATFSATIHKNKTENLAQNHLQSRIDSFSTDAHEKQSFQDVERVIHLSLFCTYV